MKKAVNFGFLDFSTLELRRHYCHREVELNRRLCPDLYLGVVAIRRTGNLFSFGGADEIAEYAVKMRRLPQDRMMDFMLRRGEVRQEMEASLGLSPGEPLIEEYGKGLYSEEERYKIYEKMLDLACASLVEGDSVILDGSFSKAAMRRAALEKAKRFGPTSSWSVAYAAMRRP